MHRIGDHAHLGDFQRLEFDFNRRDFFAEAFGFRQRRIAHHHVGGQRLGALYAVLRDADARDADTLVAEQVFGVAPALVFFADDILGGHAHVVEKHFVEMMFAVDGVYRAYGEARRFRIDQQIGNAALLLAFGAGAHQAKHPVGVMRARGPDFLPVDDIVVAIALGRGSE